MDVRALGYIGLEVTDPAAWTDYAEALGAMVVGSPADGSLAVRIDERPHRVIIGESSDGGDRLAFAGWELADPRSLEQAAAELEAAGVTVRPATKEERAQRKVSGLVHATDPSGFALELYWGPVLDHRPFRSPTGAAGFVTGDLGLGHIVLGTPQSAAAAAFYTDVLGFRVSDYWRPGGVEVVFLHCNPRHHSLALVPAAEPQLYHFMLETRTLDDVGYALDRHHRYGIAISMDLGRHPNDEMVSFYSRSPSGFDVEVGWGGRLIDDDTWTVTEITAASLWGHRPPADASP
jgi:3,4-dihydroxy-9,10-secoandrosta-1,3,5(10)-triene-9,17-dione 4,5-dioxygenase